MKFSITCRAVIFTLATGLAGATTPLPDQLPAADMAETTPAATDSTGPDSSRPAREEGDVIVKILIQDDGSVGEVHLLQSSGHQRLDESAMEWYRSKAKFAPALLDGKKVAAWKVLKVSFRLNKDGQAVAEPARK